jgi:hypothetical protein
MRWGDKTVRRLIVMLGAALAAMAVPLTALANGTWG